MTKLRTPSASAACARAVLDELVCCLATAAPTPEHVHRIRVDIKKLRGWIRLLRFAEERRIGVAADRDLRRLARVFAATRDRHVLAQTLQLLRKEGRNAAERALLSALAPRLQQPDAEQPDAELPASMLDEAAIARLQRLCARQPGRAQLRHGLKRSYRRARRRGKHACEAKADPALRHRWRKRVKYLDYQVRLVCIPQRGKRAHWQHALADLGSVLGELQDLRVLEQHLATVTPTDAGSAQALPVRLLVRASRRRVAHAARLQKRCFAARALPLRM